MATDKTTKAIDDEVAEVALRMHLRDINSLLFVYAIEHAWPAGDGQWVIRLDAPNEEVQVQRQFMSALLRCALTPDEEHKRNGLIRDAIESATGLGDLQP